METSQRRLLHLYAIGKPLFVTFRLCGSLPVGRQFPREGMIHGEAFVAMDRLLDNARFGPRSLEPPEVALPVRGCIRHCAQADCDRRAWVIMPNHVHLLFTPHITVSALMRRLKGYGARQANPLLGRTGQPFWQNESYDHLVRDGEGFRRIEEFPWSGAAGRGGSGGDPPQAWTPAAPHQN
jgi:hypothetical protein